MEIFQANNIVKEYAGHVALSSVGISVKEASIFGLLGPNGAGKTTLIRIINQITAPDSGELFFEGRPMKANDIDKIGYLPEERGLYKKMKVGEQALYLAQLKGMSKRDALKNLKYWFEKFEIQGLVGQKSGRAFERNGAKGSVHHHRYSPTPTADFRRAFQWVRPHQHQFDEERNP